MNRWTLARAAGGLLAIGAAVAIGRAAFVRVRALTATVPVVVARAAIPAYTVITAERLTVAHLPAASLPAPIFDDPAKVVGRLARVDLPAGAPIWRANALPAEELRYTDNPQAVILRLALAATRAPADLLQPGQRADIWFAGRVLAGDLRLVTVERLPDNRLAVALECSQELVPALLAAAGDPTLALTLSPLARPPTPTPSPTATAQPVLATTPTPTWTQWPTATATATPGVAIVRPGPAQGLNVRAGPGTGYPVIAVLPGGRRLTPLGRDAEGRWLLVCCADDGKPGWVLAELVDVDPNTTGLPLATPTIK